MNVLHVDDSEGATTTAEVLERENRRFEVDTARTASDALDRLDGNGGRAAFDCVVSGYDVPGADGLALLDAVRGEYPDLPFVLFADGSDAISPARRSRAAPTATSRNAPRATSMRSWRTASRTTASASHQKTATGSSNPGTAPPPRGPDSG